ncbi:nitrate ABC transporter permease [Anabaena sp. FACHB-1237]|uniref:nitrate ABC transporter permease n=1 Tax=Anabaena sp. FACHB-1237 TaxID=2692769 RepID=UPI001681707C|nr:nitrate ABC transporter permease [Anabaena sp. FACHB-1237]MBD2139738.1 nitrate ABC transporter permease [Anabaena sp. FACHB-1237]
MQLNQTLYQKFKEVIPAFSGIFILIIVWQLLSLRSNTTLPSPITVITETWDLIKDPFFNRGGNNKGFFWLILASLKRILMGYSLAVILGILVGLIISLNSFLQKGFDPIMQLLRPVAPLAWLPLAQAIFLKPNPSAVFVIFITAIWPIIINTNLGLRLIPKDYINVSKIIGLSPWEHFMKIILPASLPYILTGLRVGLGLSWLAVVAAEMLLSDDGIGFFIINAYNDANISEIIIAIVYLGMVGLIMDKMMIFISTKIAPQE